MQMNRRLYRCRENRVLAGVAAGIAEYFDLDPTLVRILWFLSVFFGGIGILLYIGLALIVPPEPASLTHPDNQAPPVSEGHRHQNRGSGRLSMYLGIGLIVLGGIALLDISLPGWWSWRQAWPVLVIGLGGLLILGAIRREREREPVEREPTEL
jgi:phage shock protein PspC (stress-responsive transcriptional regulator)